MLSLLTITWRDTQTKALRAAVAPVALVVRATRMKTAKQTCVMTVNTRSQKRRVSVKRLIRSRTFNETLFQVWRRRRQLLLRKRNFRDVHKQKKDSKVGSDKVECEQCGKKIIKWNLLRHKRDVHNYVTVNCDQCGKQVKEHVLIRHIQDTHMPKVKCSFCGKEYSESYLKVHIDAVHKGNVTVKCGQCGEQVKSLWRHLRDVHKPKVKCSFCGKLFSQRRLKVHIDRFHKSKGVKCEELGKERRKDYIQKQVGLIQKGAKSKVIKCDLCQKEILKGNLARHKKNHR